MKKIILIIAIAATTMVSCKKDRVCSCKYVTTITSNGNTVTSVQDQDFTMVDVSRKTAYYACTHTKQTSANNGVTVDTDSNCSLK